MRVLVTGGKGFLGAWIARRLARRGFELRVFDIAEDRALIAGVAGPEVAARLDWRIGDIVSRDAVLSAAEGCDAILHLAGVLTPDCAANPVRGAEINLIGTLNAFEAALTHDIARIVYTSSGGVFGPDDGASPLPQSHYGAFKLACEGSARAYWHDRGLGSVAFRPYIVYGPGRETGLTAGPTLACRAAARGEAYTIAYSGTAGLIHVDDVAAAYEAALLRPPHGAHVFNLNGVSASTAQIVDAIDRAAPGARISFDGPRLLMPDGLASDDLDTVLPGLPKTGLREGVAQTVRWYQGVA